jgi:vitamin B12 transporter
MSQKSLLQISTLSFCVGVVLAAPAHAENAALQPTIEVTASRVAETVDASLADVSVITRADIDASNAPDLIDLLRLQAGVDVVRSGGAGEQTSVFLRGTNSNHVLVLIDGTRVASSNTGAFAFENLPLDAVERVEIVRGPRASYWGSDAIGGVIQIFTRSLDAPHIAASYGSYSSADGSAGIGMQSETAGFSAQVGVRHVGGFSASNPAAGPFVYNPDDNGFQNHNIVAQGHYLFGTQKLSANVFRSEGTESFDNGEFPGSSRSLDQAAGVNLEGAINSEWEHRLSVGTSREDLATPAFGTDFHSTREQAAWTNDVALSTMSHLILGADFVHERGVSIDTTGFNAPYDVTRNNSGAFAGWRLQDGAFNSEISGRYDHNGQFGGAFSGSGALGWKLNDDLRFTANYGTAFRAPDLSELYSPGYGGYFAGNADLDPEHSRTAELGLNWRLDSANEISARGFSTRVHDLIEFTGGPLSQAINVDRAAIDGVELSHDLHAGEWSMSNRLTWQNPRNEDSDTQLVRRPKEKFSSLLERTFGDRFSGGAELAYSGKRDDIGNVILPSYALVNLRATYRLNASWRIGARLENLFDRDYELVHGYNTPGRSGFLDVVWEPR